LQLARMLHKARPLYWPTVENARDMIRHYRGKHGHVKTPIPHLPLPEPIAPTWEPYILPPDVKRWLVIADLQMRFHDLDALKCVLRFVKRRESRCDGAILLGDVLECYDLSDFCRDPAKRKAGAELAAAGQLLDILQQELKIKRVVWKEGNHEYRVRRYLWRRAAELFDYTGKDAWTLPHELKLRERNVDWVNQESPITHGHLTFFHGHEWRGSAVSPVGPARTAFMRTIACAVVGHFHMTQEFTQRTAEGTTITCWTVGALCSLHPEWRPVHNWNHGFGIFEASDPWRFHNLKIVDNNVV